MDSFGSFRRWLKPVFASMAAFVVLVGPSAAHAHGASGAEAGLGALIVTFVGHLIPLPLLLAAMLVFLRNKAVKSKLFGLALPIVSLVVAGLVFLLALLALLVAGVAYTSEVSFLFSKEQMLGQSLAVIALSWANLVVRKRSKDRRNMVGAWLVGCLVCLIGASSGWAMQRGSYELRTWNALYRFDHEHSHLQQDMAFGPEGQTLFALGSGWTSNGPRTLKTALYLWQLDQGAPRIARTLPIGSGYANKTRRLWINSAGDQAITFKGRGEVSLWSLADGNARKTPPFASKGRTWSSYCDKAHSVLNVAQGGPVQLLDLSTLEATEIPVERRFLHRIESVACAPHGELFALGLSSGLAVFRSGTGKAMLTVDTDTRVGRLAFSPDSRAIAGATHAFAGGQTSMRFWSIPDGVVQRQIVDTGLLLDFAFSPRGDRMVASWSGGRVSLYDTGSCQPLQELVTLPGSKATVEFSPDGAFVATGWSQLRPSILLFDVR